MKRVRGGLCSGINGILDLMMNTTARWWIMNARREYQVTVCQKHVKHPILLVLVYLMLCHPLTPGHILLKCEMVLYVCAV